MTQAQWTDREIRQAVQDHLNFDQYSHILGGVVQEADTPLTIGVFGPWGSGKTSLMRLVEETLAAQAQPPLTVWFNAWKYDREEALWRALVIQVLNVFRPEPARPESSSAPPHPMQPDRPPQEPQLSAEQTALNRRLDDLEASLYHTVEREEVGGVTIDWDKLLKGSVLGITHLSLSVLPGVGAVLGKMVEEAQKKISGDDLNTIFEAVQRERRKVYREHIRSLEQFQREFEELIDSEVLAKQRRLVVFIDDLDRCLPEKAIEVLEALKLFLDVPGCVFVLGADREVIQRGIRVKYKGFLVDSEDPVRADRRIPITGDDYLEKIVQLPFHLLPLDESRVEQFIKDNSPDLPAGCADIFAAGLEANPRKVKRSLNIFRLLHQLAHLRQSELSVDNQSIEVKPQLLAKIVAIQSRYPDLYRDLVEFPTLLPDLERHFAAQAEPSPDPQAAQSVTESTPDQQPASAILPGSSETLLETYRRRRPLQRLLSRGEDRFADLPPAVVKFYLYLAHTTDESGQTSASDDLTARWWEHLLSNDLTKIKVAVEAIREDGPVTVADFQRRLVAIVERPGLDYSLGKHLSAGTALALLGDPRDLDEMIPVPPGDYPLGRDRQPRRVEGFKIGKYPVTNAQYKRFLDENKDHPAPDHWDPAARSVLPELANHPVTHVTYDDARAYCRWAGKRLLSADDWEAAARGPQGFQHPYGDDGQAALSNTAKIGWGQTSPVGTFPDGASPFDVLDMAGNVWEWTQSAEQDTYLLKGGAWNSPPAETVSANSRREMPTTKGPDIGFRVAE